MPGLTTLLGEARFVVVGGVATSFYMTPRATKDIDILVYEADLTKVENQLRRSGASPLRPLKMPGALGVGGTSWRLPDNSELAVLTSSGEWAREAVEEPNRDSAGVPIVALPYLVLLKLDASRLIDMSDLGRMLGAANKKTLEKVKRTVARYLPQAADDVESIAALGQLEYRAAKQAKQSQRAISQREQSGFGDHIHVKEHTRRGRTVHEHWRRRS